MGITTNSGYIGMSMSVRAAEAYENGLKPISKWKKQDILEEIQNMNLDVDMNRLRKCNLATLKTYCLHSYEWHHTSGSFDKTDFYEMDIDGIKKLVKNGYKNIEVENKKRDEFEPGYVHGKYKEVEYHPYSKHAKYKESWIEFVNGRMKGDWIYLENGKRKKISNVEITNKTKIKKHIQVG